MYFLITAHVQFRLFEGLRKLYKEQDLKDLILFAKPLKVQVELNNTYAVFYRHNKEIIKLVLLLEIDSIKIITFYIVPKR